MVEAPHFCPQARFLWILIDKRPHFVIGLVQSNSVLLDFQLEFPQSFELDYFFLVDPLPGCGSLCWLLVCTFVSLLFGSSSCQFPYLYLEPTFAGYELS